MLNRHRSGGGRVIKPLASVLDYHNAQIYGHWVRRHCKVQQAVRCNRFLILTAVHFGTLRGEWMNSMIWRGNSQKDRLVCTHNRRQIDRTSFNDKRMPLKNWHSTTYSLDQCFPNFNWLLLPCILNSKMFWNLSLIFILKYQNLLNFCCCLLFIPY